LTTQQNEGQDAGLPQAIGRSALAALVGAGYTRLEQLSAASESEITNLHGVGPKALRILRGALAERGLSFRQ
jgi:hypothetical protein